MKLSQHGYKEETVKAYEMSVGDMILTICQAVIRNNLPEDIEIRIVDTYMGETEKWAGIKGLLTHDWAADYKVTVYKIELMHDNREDRDYVKVVMSDNL